MPSLVRAQAVEGPEVEVLERPIELPPPVGLFKELQNVPVSIRRSKPFARALSELVRKAPDGIYDIEARYQAFQQSRNDLMSASIAEKSSSGVKSPLSAAWTNIGLNTLIDQTHAVFGAGCTSTIAIDPSNPNTIYAGATSGGVWKSTDAGGHWVELTDLWIPNLSVASIAIDPKHTSTIYVGTGNAFASDGELSGTGLYKSLDAGGTWNRIGYPTMKGSIVKVLVDPVHSNVVFASLYNDTLNGTRGLYRSSDSGVSWSKVFPSSGNAAGNVWDMVSGQVIGGNPLLYFAEGATIGNHSSECGVYESVNDGLTWSKITSSVLPHGSRIGRCAMAASVADPKRVFVLMAAAYPNEGDWITYDSSLFRTSDNGASWGNIALQPSNPDLFYYNQASPQGWYDCVLGVTPNSVSGHDTMYVGGVEGWVNYSDGTGWYKWSGYDQSPINLSDWSQYPHVDQHSIAFHPQDGSRVYVGCDGGVYLTQDAGNSWQYRSNQMVTGRFYHIAVSPSSDSKTTLGGLQDQGTWQIVTGGVTRLLFGGDGMQPLVNPSSSSYPYYVEEPNGVLWRLHGTNGEQIDTGLNDNTNWETPFAMSPIPVGGVLNYHVLYTGRQHLWRSTNDGTTWATLGSTAFPDYISSFGLSTVDARNIYVGLNNGLIDLTTNAGGTWPQKLSAGNRVSSIVTTGRDTDFVLASFYTSPGSGAARIMRSIDKGAHWTNRSGAAGAALPLVGVSCVALDSANPFRIWYAATDNGIYYTIDSGGHWSIAGGGLGLAPCRDVQIQKNGTTIRVATFGRGLWEGATTALPVELSTLTYEKIQNPTQPGTLLSWHTDSERGDAGFFIERSIDGSAFVDTAFIPSKAPGGRSDMQLNYSFFDGTHGPGKYLYQLKQVDLDGSQHFSNLVELHWGVGQMIVYQNYPNPLLIGTPVVPNVASGFNPFGTTPTDFVVPSPATRFTYELPDQDVVSIKIYNSTGKFVANAFTTASGGQPVANLQQPGGTQDAYWDGREQNGSVAPSGAYIYVIESQQSGSFVGKLMLFSN